MPGSSCPTVNGATPPEVDYSGGAEDLAVISPALQEPFLIGSGLTSGGITKTFVVPAGAMRLYLGTIDIDANEHTGSFTATVSVVSVPQPTNPFTVSGVSQIGLAGATAYTTDENDSAPLNAPQQVPVTLTAGQGLSIVATGLVGFSDGIATTPPTGDSSNIETSYGGYTGIGNIRGPRGALAGIFLPATVNGTLSVPSVDFSGGAADMAVITAALQEPFLIGSGMTSGGITKTFVVPAGATQLYLGTIDIDTNEHTGSFTVTVTTVAVPQPTNPLTVSGVAQIGLAGAATYTTDENDSAPLNSPTQVPYPFTAGQGLSIVATGTVGFSDGIPTTSANGDSTTIETSYGAYKGIASIKAPRGALSGIFLPATVNANSTPALADFSSSSAEDQASLSPLLQQPFYIGTGITSGGVTKNFVVPAGAAQLFLGTVDISASEHTGSFVVTVGSNTPVAPQLQIAKAHSGNFSTGQQGATYAVTVSNATYAGSTTGVVTVTESIPAGLTLVSMAGTDWTCSGAACTRSDSLARGQSYPAITVTVNVNPDAPSLVTNQVSVSGGGSATASTTNPTTISLTSPPVITSVTPILAQDSQTITITGQGFGTSPPQTVFVGDGSVDTLSCNVTTPSMAITDSGSGSDSWEAGRETCTNLDSVGVKIASWSDTQIVLGGFGSALGNASNPHTSNIAPGDPLTVLVSGPNNSGSVAYHLEASGAAAPAPSPTTVSVSANPGVLFETTTTASMITGIVLDQYGSPMAGVTVSWSSSTGNLSAASTQTDAHGTASVTLTPNQSTQSTISATVSATAGSATGSTVVTFNPANWQSDSAFNVAEARIPLSQYLSLPIAAYNDSYSLCVDLGRCQPGQAINASLLPNVDLYLITPAANTAESAFQSALSTYFGITIPTAAGSTTQYNPVAVVVLELPVVQAIDTFFNLSLPTPLSPLCLPSFVTPFLGASPAPSASCPGAAAIRSTATGYINLAFTVSESTNTQKALSDLLQALGTDLTAIFKPSDNPYGFSSASKIGNCTGCTPLGVVTASLQPIVDLGDFTISVIDTDLNQTGNLNSYVLFDLSSLPSSLGNAVSTALTITGLVGKLLGLVDVTGQFCTAVGLAAGTGETVIGGVAFSADAIFHFAQMGMTSLDFSVETLPLTLDPSLSNNQLYQWSEAGLNVATTIVDPSASTITPSFYDSTGTLVLGYSPSTGSIIYASASGILFPYGDGYLALLAENQGSPASYSEALYASGADGVAVPYTVNALSYNSSQTVQGTSGMLMTGSSVAVPLAFNAANGSFVPQTFLSPSIALQRGAGSVTVLARALLNNGVSATASRAVVIVNGQQFSMTQQDASTFVATINGTFNGTTLFVIYMISPGIPGGFASAVLLPPNYYCDVRNDGSVHIADLQWIINEALGVIAPNHDLNGDGIVNSVDIQLVTNAALGLGCMAIQ